MAETKRTPGRRAHINALHAWYGKTKEEAEQLVDSKPYAELNNETWAETSVEAAIKGIVEKMGIPAEVGPESDFEQYKMIGAPEVYDAIIEILAEIHDKWVVENAHKYMRDTVKDENGNEVKNEKGKPIPTVGPKSDKKLYQHLPTALIGLEELANDLRFLAPFLDDMGLNPGEQKLEPWGAFLSSPEITAAYERYVSKYMEKNNLTTTAELDAHIMDTIKGGYGSLAPTSEAGDGRLEYMASKIEVLRKSVMANSPEKFGKLKDGSQPQ